ncbi:Fic/DOC family protein [Bifidobacterium crudilactis]|uniref:Fic/DOC family protein n=1 Tax=Bifidobacterium crudilactis TaxID=327277 RepID=UPI003F519AEF
MCSASFTATIRTMTTPAERASAVAFAWKNCALESLTPNETTANAARSYEHGSVGLEELLATGDAGQTADSIVARTVRLITKGWSPSGDLDELRAIHLGLFDGVYDDAGELRKADTVKATASHKGDSAENQSGAADGVRSANPEAFFPANLIETGAANISRELADKRNLKCLDRADFVNELAHIYDELGYLHPFVGGNAMVLRIFASRLAHDAGWDLDWGTVDVHSYKEAKHTAYNGDTSAFAGLFGRIIRPANPTRTFLIAGWDQGPAH